MIAQHDVPLSLPLGIAGEESVRVLKLRPPTGRQILRARCPFKRSRDGFTRETVDDVDANALLSLLSAMTTVSMATLQQMAACDLLACADEVRIYFPDDKPGLVLAAYVNVGRWCGDFGFVFDLDVVELQELSRLVSSY